MSAMAELRNRVIALASALKGQGSIAAGRAALARGRRDPWSCA